MSQASVFDDFEFIPGEDPNSTDRHRAPGRAPHGPYKGKHRQANPAQGPSFIPNQPGPVQPPDEPTPEPPVAPEPKKTSRLRMPKVDVISVGRLVERVNVRGAVRDALRSASAGDGPSRFARFSSGVSSFAKSTQDSVERNYPDGFWWRIFESAEERRNRQNAEIFAAGLGLLSSLLRRGAKKDG